MLDHHLETFDGWFQAHIMPVFAGSNFFAVITLLDQLDPKEYNPTRLLVLLQQRFPFFSQKLPQLITRMKANMEFSRIVSKFLMDRDRAGLLWVSPQTYVNLVTQILKILHAK